MSKYPYTLLPPENKPVYKPYLFIRLGSKKTHRITNTPICALVDSGADMCLCKKYIADWLGINLKGAKEEIIIAVNRSQMKACVHPLTIYFQEKIYEVSFKLSDDIPDQTPIILGQKGFFDHFKITFDLQNKEIEIL